MRPLDNLLHSHSPCKFTPAASYRNNIFKPPHVGHEAIADYWRRAASTQNTKVRMGKPLVTAERVVVEWWTTMTDPTKGGITLPGCLLLKFAEDGRCEDLWEYWQVQEGCHEPPEGWGI